MSRDLARVIPSYAIAATIFLIIIGLVVKSGAGWSKKRTERTQAMGLVASIADELASAKEPTGEFKVVEVDPKTDPWGNVVKVDYIANEEGHHFQVQVRSSGPDKQMMTKDDIWAERKTRLTLGTVVKKEVKEATKAAGKEIWNKIKGD